MPQVSLERVSKVYSSGTVAIHELTLHVAQGELLALVGPSGCGKTTTLRLIAGLERASSGDIRFDGRSVDDVPPAKRDIGFAFQRPAVYPHRTVRDNLALSLQLSQGGWRRIPLTPNGRRAAQDRINRVGTTANMLGLNDLLDRYPRQLSGGQLQRVALGRALVRNPGVLLLDEPFSNLDATLRRDLRSELHLLQRQLEATMLYVTHDPVDALGIGDRVAVMNGGQLQQVDRPEMLFRRPANRFVAEFMSWPPMSFVDGEVRCEGAGLWFDCSLGRLPVPSSQIKPWQTLTGRQITLGIRANCVEFVEPGSAIATPLEVKRAEFGGDGTLVTLGCGREEIKAILHNGCQSTKHSDIMSPGRGVMVLLKLEHSLVFDRTNGKLLSGLMSG